ncbi:circadian clock KaiB family protein [Actinopolymorpha rutila]|uniref:Circadian clock protein KaiB n=1 Tax=Actinopolymorpha rutila TaxID=446787 RepID=A0A852ZKJ8_9ACTN|nr:circadian clock protein KaiB [Actinopolymorpha rutila]
MGFPTSTRFVLTLFVVGRSGDSLHAQEQLTALCEALVPGRYELSVVDVDEEPDLAEQERIVLTPTVVRTEPLPAIRVVGDLSDDERTSAALGLPTPFQSRIERLRDEQ